MDRHHLISLHMSSKNKTNEQTEQNKTKLIDTENRLRVARGGRGRWGKMGRGSQKIQTSSYKIIESWGGHAQHDDYS